MDLHRLGGIAVRLAHEPPGFIGSNGNGGEVEGSEAIAYLAVERKFGGEARVSGEVEGVGIPFCS